MEQTRHQFQAPEVPLDSKLAGEAYRLQGDFHEDPADRILVATAATEDGPSSQRIEGSFHTPTLESGMPRLNAPIHRSCQSINL